MNGNCSGVIEDYSAISNDTVTAEGEWDEVVEILCGPSENATMTEQSSASFNGTTPFVVDPMIRMEKKMSTIYASLCMGLGVCSLLLNLFVIVALARNRRRVLKNAFYVIVLNCALLDLLRGSALTLNNGMYIYKSVQPTGINFFTYFKISRFCKWILRQGNLLTILNLLVFTSNEFVVIRYPLHYRRYCRRRVILSILCGCWVASIVFGVALMFTNGRGGDDGSEGGQGMILLFVLCYLCLFVVLVCYGFILRTIRKFHRSEEKGEFTTDGQKIHSRTLTHKSCGSCERGESKPPSSVQLGMLTSSLAFAAVSKVLHEWRCNSHRKWRSHLMSRHKYLIVIGTVLLVDILFLVPYSGMQILHYLQLRNILSYTFITRVLQWFMQIMIGVHSVCQPLCYFRMTEFRRLACCNGRAPWNKSRSFSQNKTFANTKSQMHDDYEGMELLNESPRANKPLLEHARLFVAPINPQWSKNGVKFRAYGNQLGKVDDMAGSQEIGNKKKDSALGRSKSEACLLKGPQKR